MLEDLKKGCVKSCFNDQVHHISQNSKEQPCAPKSGPLSTGGGGGGGGGGGVIVVTVVVVVVVVNVAVSSSPCISISHPISHLQPLAERILI